MIFNKILQQNSILGSAAQAASLRNEIIVNNLANADTPGFKAKAVDFEASLTEALERFKKTGELDLSAARPTIRLINENYNYRVDKNNVDVDLEMVSLYQNSIRFEAMINCSTSNSRRLTLALTGR